MPTQTIIILQKPKSHRELVAQLNVVSTVWPVLQKNTEILPFKQPFFKKKIKTRVKDCEAMEDLKKGRALTDSKSSVSGATKGRKKKKRILKVRRKKEERRKRRWLLSLRKEKRKDKTNSNVIN